MALAAPLIQSTNSVGTDSGVKVLVLGGPGTGKTRLCASMPNPIILSAESGLLSLKGSNIPFIQIDNAIQFNQAWLWVSQSAEARKFRSICIDSLSEIAENELRFAKGNTKDGRKAYGDTQDEVAKIVRNFRNLKGPHIYFSAKQQMQTNEQGQMFPTVMMPGKQLAQSIPFDFDEVFQLVRSKTPEGVSFASLRTRGSTEWDCVKDRSGKLDDWEGPEPGSDIPSLSRIIAKILA